MKENLTILSILMFILMALSFSACSGHSNNNSSSASPTQSPYTETEQAKIDAEPSTSHVDRQESSESTEDNEPRMARIDADGGLRMRKGPSTEYEIIRVIPQYQYVQLAGEEEACPDWVYVYYDGDYGWISIEFISYELDNIPTSDWAKAYYDYLSTFEAVTYTSTMYGGQYIVSGHVVGGKMRGCNLIEFWNVEGYNYPVLMSNEIPIDANGNTDVPMFSPTIYLVEHSEVVEVDQAKLSTFFQTSSNGPGFDVKGDKVIGFVLKPENGGGPENVQEALEWLKTK